MKVRRKLVLTNEEGEDGLLQREGEREAVGHGDDEDEEEDSEDLDHFEIDGFLVYDDEEEEGGDNDQDVKAKQKKKRKKRSIADIVLDNDDVELLQENRISGICPFPNKGEKFKRLRKAGKSTKVVDQFGVSDDEGLLSDNTSGEEEAKYDNEEDEMADFIVDDAEPKRERSPMRWYKMNEQKLKQLVTVCSPASNDPGAIIGDTNEILNPQKQIVAINVNADGSSEFEPFFLADKYLSERDTHVRETDMPERMQMIEEIAGTPPLDEMSREEESAWIVNELARNSHLLFFQKGTPERSEEGSALLKRFEKANIVKFLELYHVEKFDIPFIAMYRKEQCLGLLEDIEQDDAEKEDTNDVGQACKLKWHKVLWFIKELDRKWLLLQKRKSALKMYQRRRYAEKCPNIDDSERSMINKKLFDFILKSLDKAESKEEIDDVDAKFSLHFPPLEDRMNGKYKRPIKKSYYSTCMKAGLWKLASQFGHISEHLSKQIALEKLDMEFQGYPDESPKGMALSFTCASFATPELVLKGARHMAALEISCDPCIKKHIRSIFIAKAVVSTTPTLEGNVTIDSFHQFSGVKWLSEKPLSKFSDAQWLLIRKAEEEKLLQVSIKLPEVTLNELIASFNDVCLIDGTGRSAQPWKEQCKLILHDALFNFLLPSMEKEAQDLLTSRAKQMLLMEYGNEFWKKVSVGPYLCSENVLGSVVRVAPKVMSCCWGPGKPATIFVVLDSSGELLDVLEARSLNLRSLTIDAQQSKKNDQQRVLNFMKNHRPHVIVIGAVNAPCVQLKDDLKEMVSKLEEQLRELGQDMNGISVVFGDESLPQLYEHSQISSEQLPGQPGTVRRAVALGRYLQNPLAMVASLCGVDREILSWKLSSLEQFLTPDEKYEMIEQVMVDVTNQVGVDINFAVNHDWYFPLVQFVSGLGPQKAAVLQREVLKYRAVNNRNVLANFGVKTKKVFHNAIGFLCVRGGQLPCSSYHIDPLDSTRIHPESYKLAEGLAKAVCNDFTEAPIDYVKKEPQLLNAFNIDDYSDSYELEEGENRQETFYHIKKELLHGFLDPREPYKEPSLDEEFNMICCKNGTALAEGTRVEAVVRHVQSRRAFCVLDSGLTVMIMKEDFSDEEGEYSLEDKLHEGDKLSCKVKQIDKSKCQVLLTCKESEMKSSTYEDIQEIDPYYHESGRVSVNQQEKACTSEKLGQRHFERRIISHPFFRNMTVDEAREFLSDKDAGESIFHPSSRGPHYLTLTLKVFDGIYVNKDIIESGKDHKDITSLLHLGKILKIGDDTFGDLDEVMSRYAVPLVKHLKEMLGFRKFKRGTRSEVDEVLRAEKSEYPTRIVYCFGVSYEHPGTFILSYIRNVNLHHEYVGLLPNGFKFRKRTFEKIEHLVGFFQKNIDGSRDKSLTLGDPAIGNSSGAYTGADRDGQLNRREDKSVSRGRSDCLKDGDEDGTNEKWGNDTNFGPNREDMHGGTSGGAAVGNWGSGGNSDRNDDTRNNEWNKEWSWDGCSSGWGGTKNGDSGGSDGVWGSSGNNVDTPAQKWGHSGGNSSGGGCSGGWGGTKYGDSGDNDGVWRASEDNVGERAYLGGRGGGRRGGSHTSSWGNTLEDENGSSFGGNEGEWHAGGNDGSGRGRGGWDSERGGHRGGGRGGWDSQRSGHRGSGRGGWDSDRGGRRGGGRGGWDSDRGGCRGGGRSSWDSESERGGRRGGGRGAWDNERGGRRGSGRNGRGFGRGRDSNNERGDYNSSREREFGNNSSTWGSYNEERKWGPDNKTNFSGGSSYGGWGNENASDGGDNNVSSGKPSGGSWNSNAGASVGGSSWGRNEGGNGGWDNANSAGKGILGSRPDAGNQGGWGSSEAGNKWGGSGNGGW